MVFKKMKFESSCSRDLGVTAQDPEAECFQQSSAPTQNLSAQDGLSETDLKSSRAAQKELAQASAKPVLGLGFLTSPSSLRRCLQTPCRSATFRVELLLSPL